MKQLEESKKNFKNLEHHNKPPKKSESEKIEEPSQIIHEKNITQSKSIQADENNIAKTPINFLNEIPEPIKVDHFQCIAYFY